jgi:hypothetical protein
MASDGEQLRGPVYAAILPVRIVAIGSREDNLTGQTRDLGVSGVRFIIPERVREGKRIEYIITRSSGSPGTEIRFAGRTPLDRRGFAKPPAIPPRDEKRHTPRHRLK